MPKDQSLVTNCYKWKYSYDKELKRHYDAAYIEGQNAAQFLLLRFKDSTYEKRGELIKHLSEIHKNITGYYQDVGRLPYWNFGLTLFDLGNWRQQQLTDVYQRYLIITYFYVCFYSF